METPQTPDELKFSENVAKLGPILKELDYLLSDGRISLKTQGYRIQNQNMTIQDQEKRIAQNKVLLDDVENQLKVKYATREAELAEKEKNVQLRAVELNHKEREQVRKEEALNKLSWELNDKKKVKV